MLNLACSNEEKVKVRVDPTSATGKAAELDGPVRVTVQSGDGTFTQDPAEPNAFYVVSSDKPGTTTYLVEGDADLGEGTTLLQDTVTLEVSGANATSFGLVGGAPEPK